MKRLLPMTIQGEDTLAASRLPPVTALANRHAPSAAHPGRAAAAVNAAPIAPAAHRSRRSGSGRITSPPSSAHSAEKLTASSPARPANRRTQPRAVVYGTLAAAAAGRTPGCAGRDLTDHRAGRLGRIQPPGQDERGQ
jgi:hypothetical protein